MNDRNAIVIGSGFGGAVTACRLAQAGFRVVILERGRRFEAGDFPALPAEDSLLPDHRRWSWQADQGLWDIEDLGELINVQSAGYGGGSLVYANVHLRPPAGVFDERWPEEVRRAKLDPFYDLVGYMLDASPLPENANAPKVTRLETYAKDKKHGFFRPPLAITFSDNHEHLGIERKSCKLCAQCSTGCPYGAKNSLDHNYLALAERWGAQVFTRCEVTALEREPGGWKVSYTDHSFERQSELSAPYVFLCAGALHSTRLLAKYNADQAARKQPTIANVGLGYYPNADAIGMVYRTREKLEPAAGPTIGGTVVHWNDQKSDFFLLQEGGYSKELDRVLSVFRSSVWLNRNRVTTAKPGSYVDALLKSVAASVALPQQAFKAEALPSPADSLRMVVSALTKVNPWQSLVQFSVYFSPFFKPLQNIFGSLVGADDPGHRMMLLTMGRDSAPGVLHYDQELERMIADLDLFHAVPMYERQKAMMTELAAHLGGELRTNPAWTFLGKPYTVHGQGGCRMGTEKHGVTTSDGQVIGDGVDGLYVSDGSVLCTSVGVNPSATIAAIAERNVQTFIEAHGGFEQAAGRAEYEKHKQGAARWGERAREQRWQIEPPLAPSPKLEPTGLGLFFDETLRGLYRPMTEQDELAKPLFEPDHKQAARVVRELEASASEFVELTLGIHVVNLRRFIEDFDHTSNVSGTVTLRLPGAQQRDTYKIRRGQMRLLASRAKPYALDPQRKQAQEEATGCAYVNQQPSAADRTRFITYDLELAGADQSYWILRGTKYVRQDAGIDFWEDTSTLHITLHGPFNEVGAQPQLANLQAAGIVRLGPLGFFEDQRKIRVVRETEDSDALIDETDFLRSSWAKATYWRFFYASLQRIYSPTIGGLGGSLFSASALSSTQRNDYGAKP